MLGWLSQEGWDRRRWAAAALLALGTLALYARVAGHQFLFFDDDRYVTANAQVLGGLSWDGVRWGFGTFDVELQLDAFPEGVTIYDLVYRPAVTKLMRQAEEHGGIAIGGLGMLVHQGAVAFKLWTGVEPPLDAMFAAAHEALGTH